MMRYVLNLLHVMLNFYTLTVQIQSCHKRSDGLMGDFCDGKTFRDHTLFSSNPKALQVMLYYDDVEICNPLGSKSKIHKLGM